MDIKKHSLYKDLEEKSILSIIYNLYVKRFGVLFIFSFFAVFIIQFAYYQFGFWELYKIDIENTEEFLKAFYPLLDKIVILSVISVIIYGFLNAFLINYLIKKDINPNINVGDILIESTKKYSIHMIFFLILALLILLFGFIAGFIALVIGSVIASIYIVTILLPGMTILVTENKNAIEVIARTFTLTHKDFWSALRLLLIMVFIIIVVSSILSGLLAIPVAIKYNGSWSDMESFQSIFRSKLYNFGMWSVIINSLTSAIVYPFYSIFSLITYYKLRLLEVKSGI